MKTYLTFVLIFALLLIGFGFWNCARQHPPSRLAVPPHIGTCDPTLWQHVYHGKRFATAQDRLKPIKVNVQGELLWNIEDCVTVTGTLHFVTWEKDGDAHMLLKVDQKFSSMPNAKNKPGTLVVESECERDPKQADTIGEGVCDDWHQHLYNSALNGKHVAVTGAYVEDMEHGWRECHPITSITLIEPDASH